MILYLFPIYSTVDFNCCCSEGNKILYFHLMQTPTISNDSVDLVPVQTVSPIKIRVGNYTIDNGLNKTVRGKDESTAKKKGLSILCPVHAKKLTKYCLPCNKLLCLECGYDEHKGPSCFLYAIEEALKWCSQRCLMLMERPEFFELAKTRSDPLFFVYVESKTRLNELLSDGKELLEKRRKLKNSMNSDLEIVSNIEEMLLNYVSSVELSVTKERLKKFASQLNDVSWMDQALDEINKDVEELKKNVKCQNECVLIHKQRFELNRMLVSLSRKEIKELYQDDLFTLSMYYLHSDHIISKLFLTSEDFDDLGQYSLKYDPTTYKAYRGVTSRSDIIEASQLNTHIVEGNISISDLIILNDFHLEGTYTSIIGSVSPDGVLLFSCSNGIETTGNIVVCDLVKGGSNVLSCPSITSAVFYKSMTILFRDGSESIIECKTSDLLTASELTPLNVFQTPKIQLWTNLNLLSPGNVVYYAANSSVYVFDVFKGQVYEDHSFAKGMGQCAAIISTCGVCTKGVRYYYTDWENSVYAVTEVGTRMFVGRTETLACSILLPPRKELDFNGINIVDCGGNYYYGRTDTTGNCVVTQVSKSRYNTGMSKILLHGVSPLVRMSGDVFLVCCDSQLALVKIQNT